MEKIYNNTNERERTVLVETAPTKDYIVVKNEFYPSGLSGKQVWEHYQKVKHKILPYITYREIMLYFAVDTNKFIIIRKKNKSTNEPEFLRINSKNFNQVISGRTLVIYPTMSLYESIGIIDIDTSNFEMAKFLAIETLQYLVSKQGFSNELVKIRFTGKTSFHVLVDFSRRYRIEKIKEMLQNFIVESQLLRYATMSKKRTSQTPNFDLSPNKFRGAWISPFSLSTEGLMCTEFTDYKKLNSFRKGDAKIL